MGDDERPTTAALLSSAHVELIHDGVQCCICTLSVDQAQPLFYSWAAREGWNPASIDPLLWAAIDERGFHALYRTTATTASASSAPASATAEPICILATLVIDDTRAFLGPFITAAAYQRRGFGSLLFEWAMRRLEPARRCIGLDSTLEQQPSYHRRGFEHTAAEEWRYAGIVAHSDGTQLTDAAVDVVAVANSDSEQLQQLYALYERCSESSLFNQLFCHTLLTSHGCVAFAALSSVPASPSQPTAHREVSGLIVARRAGRGYRVAPLFARSAEVAVALLQRLQVELGRGGEDECGIHIDVPSSHTAAVALMERLSLKKIFASVRLYTRPPRCVPHDWVYGSEPCP